MTCRAVVAGFGNVLRGDDGFGVEVVRRLEQSGRAPQGTVFLEVGTGGLSLAQELLTPCDRLVVVDAMTRGGEPGRLYILQVDEVVPAHSVDMHMALPARALGLARALGRLPREVFLVGCEPAVVDELTMTLSAVVRHALDTAVAEVQSLLERPHG
jgi:hydrogenase maturation protease